MTQRYPMSGALTGKTFAEGDVVTRGPGGTRGTVQSLGLLGGRVETVDVEWNSLQGASYSHGISPRFLVVVQTSP